MVIHPFCVVREFQLFFLPSQVSFRQKSVQAASDQDCFFVDALLKGYYLCANNLLFVKWFPVCLLKLLTDHAFFARSFLLSFLNVRKSRSLIPELPVTLVPKFVLDKTGLAPPFLVMRVHKIIEFLPARLQGFHLVN